MRVRKSGAEIACKLCGASRVIKFGKNTGEQRYKCNDCGRLFYNRETGRVPAEVKRKAMEMYLNNVGIRKTAKFLKVSPTAVVNWVKEANSRLEELPPETVTDEPDIIELDEIYTYCAKKNSKC
jgi:transposase-like protein